METEVLTKFKRYCDSASDFTETLTIRNEFSTELLDLRRELIYEIDANLKSDSAPHKIESYINEVKLYAELVLSDVIKEFEDTAYRPDVRNGDEFFKEIQDDLKFVGDTLIAYCDKSLKKVSENETGKKATAKDKLTHKQQILLLHSVGFFDLEVFSQLNETQKGVLVGHIVNRDEKNSEDNIRYVKGKRANEDTQKIFTKDNLHAVNELLEKVGLKQYKIS